MDLIGGCSGFIFILARKNVTSLPSPLSKVISEHVPRLSALFVERTKLEARYKIKLVNLGFKIDLLCLIGSAHLTSLWR